MSVEKKSHTDQEGESPDSNKNEKYWYFVSESTKAKPANLFKQKIST